MGEELSEAYRRCDADDAVRAVVLTGTPPAFCAGADLSSGAATFAKRDEETFSAAALDVRAWDVRKPVIAAVNGHAIGVGFTITLQCDIRYFAADAKYGIVQVRRGVMGDGYSHWTLPRITGMAAAADILLTGRMFDGHEAKELGVCTRVLPNEEVFPAALELAHDIAVNTAPLSVAFTKRLLWESWDRSPGRSSSSRPMPTITSWADPTHERASWPSWSVGPRHGRAVSPMTTPRTGRQIDDWVSQQEVAATGGPDETFGHDQPRMRTGSRPCLW